MSDIQQYLKTLLADSTHSITERRKKLFDSFVQEDGNVQMVREIYKIQESIMEKWELRGRISDIMNTHIILPNATVGKPYHFKLDLDALGLNDIGTPDLAELSDYGLSYDFSAGLITGVPTQAGDFKISFKFRLNKETEDAELHEKKLSLIVNPDPKTLWKDIPSVKEDGNYWKTDGVSDFQQLGDKQVVVASKRGRSHANVGSFRDDDYAFKHLEDTGWSVVCVADGAGSARFSREGSKLACNAVVEYFSENFSAGTTKEFDEILHNHHHEIGEDASTKISHFVYNNLSKAAMAAYKEIEGAASKIETSIKDFHTTLIFTVFKKYGFGYAILTFGVGDCPIGLLNKDVSEVKLMNWLDVGEFGGGTRFITMPEIFTSDKFFSRFGFKLIKDFSYLMLMTDGIYDAKFIVEANLEQLESWKAFLEDLDGKNEDGTRVQLSKDNQEIGNQLLQWMDFWSPGNHDDRTLAIIF